MVGKRFQRLKQAVESGDIRDIRLSLLLLHDTVRVRACRGDRTIQELWVEVDALYMDMRIEVPEDKLQKLMEAVDRYEQSIRSQELTYPAYVSIGVGRACYPAGYSRYRPRYLAAPPNPVPGSGNSSPE